MLICNVRLPITALSLDPPNSTASNTAPGSFIRGLDSHDSLCEKG